jgi:hypothetical protein
MAAEAGPSKGEGDKATIATIPFRDAQDATALVALVLDYSLSDLVAPLLIFFYPYLSAFLLSLSYHLMFLKLIADQEAARVRRIVRFKTVHHVGQPYWRLARELNHPISHSRSAYVAYGALWRTLAPLCASMPLAPLKQEMNDRRDRYITMINRPIGPSRVSQWTKGHLVPQPSCVQTQTPCVNLTTF